MMPSFVEAFVAGIVVVFGLIWGSYLNVVVYRLPRGLSTASPPSHCPRCSSRIRPYENVPVLSWLLQGGRCRHCHGAISLRYPMVEASVAVIFLLGFRRFDEPLSILASWVLGCVLLALALIDFDRRLVPMALTLPFGIAVWAIQPWLGWATPADAVVTSLVAGGLFVMLSAASARWPARRVAEGPGLGIGDAYAVFLVGAMCGSGGAFRVVLLALAGAVGAFAASHLLSFVSGLVARRRLPAADRLPLATFLALAALWVLLGTDMMSAS